MSFEKKLGNCLSYDIHLVDFVLPLGASCSYFLLLLNTIFSFWTKIFSNGTLAMSSRIGSPVLSSTVLTFHSLNRVEFQCLKKLEGLTCTKNKEKYVVPTKLGDFKCHKKFDSLVILF